MSEVAANVDLVLQQLREKAAWAKQVGDNLMAESNPARKLSEARRGNSVAPHVKKDIDKVFALTVDEEIKRTKASLKRFVS